MGAFFCYNKNMLRGIDKFNLPELEEKVLRFWKESAIFTKSLQKRKKGKPFRFFEGPPTANGKPGIHHVLGRAFKDIVLRYKTMQGYYVPRRAGWDTHGLPVEIEVEKELGLKEKKDIEKFGIAAFNAKAKASVWKYKTEWEKLTERIGFWLDFDNPYVTYENDYIESLWWVLAQIEKKKYLKKLYKVVPWCPRCQTGLSSHELGQPGVYKKKKDPSLYVKFKIKNGKGRLSNEYLLVWTTTPWTLPANVAIAVNTKLTYTKYRVGDEYLWSFTAPPAEGGAKVEVVEKMSGKKLVGTEYAPLYKVKDEKLKVKSFYKVVGADFVSTEEGTGLVHLAPAYGEDDLAAVGHEGVVLTIEDDGTVKKGLGIPGEGQFIKKADNDIVADLTARGLVFSFGEREHDYPFCWRCGTLLIYLARLSWFITMSALRQKMISENQKINWIPEHIKDGRFGEWLKELKDWAITRKRYWGTPLPIWECGACDTYSVMGGLDDIKKNAYHQNTFYFIRHGEGEHNLSNTIASGPEKNGKGAKLTEKGKKQVAALAKKLKNKKITAIYASPYLRTKETAKIFAKAIGAKVIVDERLEELNTGIFNGRPERDYHQFFAQPIERFTKTPPSGENLRDVRSRMMAFIQDINNKHRHERIAVVSHGDPLWVLEGAIKGGSEKEIVASHYGSYIQPGEARQVVFAEAPYTDEGVLDFHRPFIDTVTLACKKCDSKMVREEGVADVWFDSGAMPYAQWHYPFEHKMMIDKKLQFPADYISEGIDQTRGWFYTLLAVSVLLGKGAPYNNVISLGLLLDKNGQKMSKSKGNVVDPWEMAQKYGMDTVRWYFYTINPPGEPKRFDEDDLAKTMRKVFMILYNSFVFYNTYVGQKTVNIGAPIAVMDEWILTRLDDTIKEVTARLNDYDIQTAGRVLEGLIDDLSRWYIRRTRKNVSPATLKKVLVETAKLLAPFAPFFSDALYQSFAKGSVHLQDWPTPRKKLSTAHMKLVEDMREVRDIAAKALAAREEAKIKVRQPLQALKVKSEKLKGKTVLIAILKDEVNVKEVVFDQALEKEVELDTEITPQLKVEGMVRELVRALQGLRQDAGYNPEHKAIVMLELPPELYKTIGTYEAEIAKSVNASHVRFHKEKVDAELITKLDGREVWLGVRRK